MIIVWEEEAEQDLGRIFDYILEHSPSSALSTLQTIRDSVAVLADHPYMGRTGRVLETRESVIVDTPYLAAYQVVHERVVILRVFHGAQHWPDRFD